MNETVQFFVEQGSYGLMLAALLIAGLGLPLPEDIVLISGGILIQRGVTSIWATVTICVIGVLVGDTTLFLLARRAGPAMYRRKFIAKVLPPARRAKLEGLFAKYGGLVIFCARHVAGLRAPVFAVAAIHGMSLWRFLLWDTLALGVSLPVVMYLGWLFADSIEQALDNVATVEHYILIAVFAVILLVAAWHTIKAIRKRREAPPVEEPAPEGPPSPPPAAEDVSPT
jgi:membrane protein DedA with SNARE-associated domain